MMHQRLMLQRRRLYVVSLLLYIAGLTGFGQSTSGASIGAVFFSAALCVIFGIVVASLIVLWAPSLRRLCESTAAGALMASAISHLDVFELSGLGTLALLTIGSSVAVYLTLYGTWWSRVPFRFDWTTRRQFKARCPAQAAWSRLVPDPDNPGAHYSGAFLSQEQLDDPGQVLEKTLHRDGGIIETTLRFERLHPPHEIAYTYESRQEGAEYGRGHFHLTVTPHDKFSTVWFAEKVIGLVIPTAISLWFDDFGGEMRISMQSVLNDRVDPTLWMRHRTSPTPIEVG